MFEQAYATSSESSKQLENKYMELLQHLHYKLNCLVIYVNGKSYLILICIDCYRFRINLICYIEIYLLDSSSCRKQYDSTICISCNLST